MGRMRCGALILLVAFALVSGPFLRAVSCSTGRGRNGLSALPTMPPEIDGVVETGEWDNSGRYQLKNGFLRVLNDAVNLYILLDVVNDTVDDSPIAGEPPVGDIHPIFQGDAFSIAVDIGNDKNISNADLNYRIMPGTSLLGVEKLVPEDSPLIEASHSSLGIGFGTSIDSSVPHRIWEIALTLREFLSLSSSVVRIGVMLYSPNPLFRSEDPDGFYSDFTDLIEIALAIDTIDLLILTDASFTDALLPLKQHKDTTGIKTYIQSWQSLNKTMDGRDEPEKIKYAIHYYKLLFGIKYVMLVGDCDRFPVRYVKGYNSEWGVNYLASDLYYADLYDSGVFPVFDDWDWDNDGAFGELNYSGGTNIAQVNLDKIDMRPDVSVGRIPASTVAEVKTYVDKVIHYELTTTASDWFKRALYVVDGGPGRGGDPAKKDAIDQYLDGFSITKMYQDNSPWNTMSYDDLSAGINSELNEGTGFVNMMGHGNRFDWSGLYDSSKIEIAFASNSSWHPYFFVKEVSGVGDFNGDGKDDIVTFVRNAGDSLLNGTVWVALSSGSNFGWPQLWNSNFTKGSEVPAVGDFNGDGKDDIIFFYRGDLGDSNFGQVYVALSNGSSFGQATKWHGYFCVREEVPRIGDVNGDGKDDIVTFIRSTAAPPGIGDVYVALSNGTAFGKGQRWHEYFCLGSEIPDVGDFNSDGKDDIVTFVRSTKGGAGKGDVYVALSNGTEFGESELWHDYFCIDNELPAVGDFNGDGKDDVASFIRNSQPQTGTGDVWVALSNGTVFSTTVRVHTQFASDGGQVKTGDVTGDGNDDFVTFQNVSSGIVGEVTVSKSAPSNNQDKLPVVFAVSCYTGRFIFDRDFYQAENGSEWTGGETERPAPNSVQPAKYDRESLAEYFLVKSTVGAVGYIGCTDPYEYGGDPLDKYFFEAYSTATKPPALGYLWSKAIDKFVVNDAIPVAQYYYAFIHMHKVMLFGDPSLRVGGLPYLIASIPRGLDLYDIIFRSNSLISNYEFRELTEDLTFTVTGPEDSVRGFTNLAIPKSLLVPINRDAVLLDGVPIPYQIAWNLTHSFISFQYPHSSHQVLIRGDNTPPSIEIQSPHSGTAAQDGLTLSALASDPNGVDTVMFSIRQSDGTVVDQEYEDMQASGGSGDSWVLWFDTTLLPDGHYLFEASANDTLGNQGSETVDFSIRNWATMELLPASETNKAGRTVPVKFSLRIAESVNPDQPFVWNEELVILIHTKDNPANVLQESVYGTTSKDYRIDAASELYITNFKTLTTPRTYVVEIYRKGVLVGTFEFKTVK